MKNKKLYVIVEYNFQQGGYDAYAIDGLVFNDENVARQYMSTKPFNANMGVEELTLHKEG